ncbi:MAG: YeeE/YedE family protein [Bdellovibrionales bacterium]
MNLNNVIAPLIGGALIGIAVTVMLLFNGRVTGISGIVSGLFSPSKRDFSWRSAFIVGMLAGGVALRLISPNALENTSGRTLGAIALAGILVGFGTVMGGGCTSGHGVCGVSRFSIRSLIATATFIFFGFASVMLMKMINGGLQ